MKLWICVLVLVSSSAVAQMPSSPPVKMGLWQAEVSTRTSGGGYPDAPAEKTTQQSCVTPETWKKLAGSSELGKGCSNTKESYAGHTYSVDTVCTATADSRGSSSSHIEIVFDTQEALHISMKMTMDQGDGKPLSMVSTGSAKFVAAACGDVSP